MIAHHSDSPIETDQSVSERSSRRGAVFGVIGVTLVALTLLVPATGGKGPEMDEGAVVAYASRVLDGAVPHRDFFTLYGPGNPWLVAGAFAVFDSSVTIERGVGVAYRLIIALSLLALAWRVAGPLSGLFAGVFSTILMARELVWAYATYGAIAFGLLGLVFLGSGITTRGRLQQATLLAAGSAGGIGVLIRFEFAPAVAISALPLLAFVSWRSRISYAVGFGLSAGLYVPHLTVVGSDRIGRVIEDFMATGPARRLPVPPPWVELGDLLALGVFGMALLVVVGAVRVRADPASLDGRVLLSAGLLAAGILPWVIFRADAMHIRPFALVPVSLLPATAVLLTRTAPIGSRVRLQLTAVVVAVASLALVEQRQVIDARVQQLRGVRYAHRGFYDDHSAAARAIVARAEKLTEPGDSLFVGPQDLRRSTYGATYIYFLLRNLRPASYYMELNPMTANRQGSGLGGELRRADWLILTSEWDDWYEPNESSKRGPSEPNEIVRRLFCLRFESGEYRLYERCDRRRSEP